MKNRNLLEDAVDILIILSLAASALALNTDAQGSAPLVSEDFESSGSGALPEGWAVWDADFEPSATAVVSAGTDGDLALVDFSNTRSYIPKLDTDTGGKAIDLSVSFMIPDGGSLAVCAHAWGDGFAAFAVGDWGGYGMHPRVWDYGTLPNWDQGPFSWSTGDGKRVRSVAEREVLPNVWYRLRLQGCHLANPWEPDRYGLRFRFWQIGHDEPQVWDVRTTYHRAETEHAVPLLSSVASGGFQADNVVVQEIPTFDPFEAPLDGIAHRSTNRGGTLHVEIAWAGPCQWPGSVDEPGYFEGFAAGVFYRKWCVAGPDGSRWVGLVADLGDRKVWKHEGSIEVAGVDITDTFLESIEFGEDG